MRVVVVPVGRIGTLDAAHAGAEAAKGWATRDSLARCHVFPMSAGGPGFAGADGGPVQRLGGHTLIDGNAYLPGPLPDGRGRRPAADYVSAPWARATTRPLGEALAGALRDGERVVVGLGETAALDGGAGMLAGMLDAFGADDDAAAGLSGGLVGLDRARIDWPDCKPLIEAISRLNLTVAYADATPLLGMQGLAARLAERRIVNPAAAQEAEHVLVAFEVAAVRALGHADRTEGRSKRLPVNPRAATRPGTGSGGGSAFLLGLLGAHLTPGAEWWASEFDLEGALSGADAIVALAERIDWRLADGVLPVLAREANQHALPLIALARECGLTRTERADLGLAGVYEAGPGGAPDWPFELAARVARTWARPPGR